MLLFAIFKKESDSKITSRLHDLNEIDIQIRMCNSRTGTDFGLQFGMRTDLIYRYMCKADAYAKMLTQNILFYIFTPSNNVTFQ